MRCTLPKHTQMALQFSHLVALELLDGTLLATSSSVELHKEQGPRLTEQGSATKILHAHVM